MRSAADDAYELGTPGFDALAGATALAVSPEGSQLYVLGSGEDALTVMRRDSVDGSLTQVAVLRQGQGAPVVDGLSTAFSMAFCNEDSFNPGRIAKYIIPKINIV